MIASLRGILLEKNLDTVVIEAGGVGYAVTVTAAAQRALPPAGAEARLFIHTHAVQDSPWQLFGFAEPEERTHVRDPAHRAGVGPKSRWPFCRACPSAIWSAPSARLTCPP